MFRWSRPPTFRVTQVTVHGQVMLWLSGSATSDRAAEWQDLFLRLSAERHPLLLLDLSELVSASNLFLTCLERLVDCQQRHGGQVRLLRPRPVVREMIALYEMEHLIEWDEPTGTGDYSGFVRIRSSQANTRPASASDGNTG